MKYSIIVAVYNGEKYIDKCMTSLLNQSYKNYEVIIVNDGSTDKSLDMIEKYSKEHKKIKVYNTTNNGVSSARNYGISKSTGDYFIFVDIDDFISKNMLTYINSKIGNQIDIDLIKYQYSCVSNDSGIQDNNDEQDTFEILDGPKAFKKLVTGKVPFDLSCIYTFRRKFWELYNFKFEVNRYHEDFGLIPYAIMKAKKIMLIDKVLYYYVQSENSITRNNNREKQVKKFNDILYHFDNLFNKVCNDNQINKEDKKLFNSYISNAVLLSYKILDKKDKKISLVEIRKRNIVDMLLSDTFIRKVKKMIYKKVII